MLITRISEVWRLGGWFGRFLMLSPAGFWLIWILARFVDWPPFLTVALYAYAAMMISATAIEWVTMERRFRATQREHEHLQEEILEMWARRNKEAPRD